MANLEIRHYFSHVNTPYLGMIFKSMVKHQFHLISIFLLTWNRVFWACRFVPALVLSIPHFKLRDGVHNVYFYVVQILLVFALMRVTFDDLRTKQYVASKSSSTTATCPRWIMSRTWLSRYYQSRVSGFKVHWVIVIVLLWDADVGRTFYLPGVVLIV